MPPKYRNTYTAPETEIPSLATIADKGNISDAKEDPIFHWKVSDKSTHTYLMEHQSGIEFVSSDENKDTTMQALVDSFEEKYGLTINLKQVKYYMTNPTAESYFDKEKHLKDVNERKQLNLKLAERMGKELGKKAGKDGPLWKYATDAELNKPFTPDRFSYRDMYFEVFKDISKQLSDKMIAEGKSIDERKEAVRNLLYDFGTTMTGIYAACGGFKSNPDPEGGRYPREAKGYATLFNPMFGEMPVTDFNDKINACLPKEFLRRDDLEKPVDLATINEKQVFEPGEILYLGNEVRLAQQKSASHGKIARFFASLPLFGKMDFAKEIRKDDAHLRDMERVALKFAPVKEDDEKPYKDNAEKLRAGVRAITELADKISNNQVIEVATKLRDETKNNMLNKADALFSMFVFSQQTGLNRFRTISASSFKNRINIMYNRVYGEVALNKIAEVTECPDLVIENNPNSVNNTYKDQGKDYAMKQDLTNENMIKYFQNKGSIDNSEYGIEQFDSWMEQIHRQVCQDNQINSTAKLPTEEEMLQKYDVACSQLSADFNENTKNVKNQTETLEADQFNKVQKPALRILGQKENAPQVQMVEGSETQNMEQPTQEEGFAALQGAGVLNPERYTQDLPTGNNEPEKEEEKEQINVDLDEQNLSGDNPSMDDNQSKFVSLDGKTF